MSAYADQNHAPSLTCVRLELESEEKMNETDTDCRKEGKNPFFFCTPNCRQSLIEECQKVTFAEKDKSKVKNYHPDREK